MNDDELIRQAMSLLGKRTSEKKRASSIANAKKPRKRKRLTKPLALTVPNGEKP